MDIRLRRKASAIVLEVSDTGPGIAESKLERVFDRIYRAEGTGLHGSGLGLAIVKNIADQHQASFSLGRAGADGGLLVCVALMRA